MALIALAFVDVDRSPEVAAVEAVALAASVPPVETAVASPVVTAFRADWPAAISGRGPAPTVPSLPKEHGTDGLMGRLPFGLPNDTPTIRVERTNRFTLDDVQATWSGYDTTPPWVRRLGGLTNFRTDPYQR